MARFNIEDAKNYGGGGSNFFSLKDDKESANVRFLINNINDLYGVSCHEVDVNGKKTDIECLRAYNEPVEKCPFCNAGYPVNAKLFIPVYDEKAKESKLWSRGKKFFDRMANLCSRYNPLVGTSCEIVRIGKKGDTQTSYEIYPGRSDDKRITDFPPIDAEGVGFQVKTYEEMENYLLTGNFDIVPTRSHSQEQRQVPMRRMPRSEEESF